jgi:ISXO2 transposase-like protein
MEAPEIGHPDLEWVRGDVHTNTIESAWSLFNRSVVGAYHKLSTKHMDACLNEFEWRYNNRKNPFLFRDTLAKLVSSKQLDYKALIA